MINFGILKSKIENRLTESYGKDTLKKDLTNSEWVKLGDSTEPYTEYAKDEYGSYIQDSEGNFLTYQKRDFKPNTAAIPNVLELIYNSKGLDSSSYCEKIEVVKLLHFFTCHHFNKLFLQFSIRIYQRFFLLNNNHYKII